jgi:hypothetical protein
MTRRSSRFSLRQIVLASLAAATLLIGLVCLWLYFPALRSAGISNGYACSRAHIYLPVRLDFKGCKTVTGVVTRVKIELDGDIHARLLPDKQFQNLLTSQNYKRQSGNLVIEDMCQHSPKDSIEIFAKLSCYHYKSPFQVPVVGKRYEITGNYVVDDWHGSWAEIHGLSELKQIK